MLCDELGLNYEQYLKSLFQHYHINADKFRFAYPVINTLASDNAQNIWEDYQTSILRNTFIIQRPDIEKPNLPWLLPENFPSGDPETLKKQCATIHDKIFIEIERIGYNIASLFDTLDKAISSHIIPQAWAEGFGTYHHISKLESYRYTPAAERKSIYKDMKFKTA